MVGLPMGQCEFLFEGLLKLARCRPHVVSLCCLNRCNTVRKLCSVAVFRFHDKLPTSIDSP